VSFFKLIKRGDLIRYLRERGGSRLPTQEGNINSRAKAKLPCDVPIHIEATSGGRVPQVHEVLRGRQNLPKQSHIAWAGKSRSAFTGCVRSIVRT